MHTAQLERLQYTHAHTPPHPPPPLHLPPPPPRLPPSNSRGCLSPARLAPAAAICHSYRPAPVHPLAPPPLAPLGWHHARCVPQLNWHTVQVIATAKAPGSEGKFPNKGRFRYEGRNMGGAYLAKYLGALVANTGCVTPEVRSRIRKATAALTKLARRAWTVS